MNAIRFERPRNGMTRRRIDCPAGFRSHRDAWALSVVVCALLTTSVRAQAPPESRPQPEPRPRSERPAQTEPRAAVLPDPDLFAVPPGLSQEAIRSYREIPPGLKEGKDAEPMPPPSPFMPNEDPFTNGRLRRPGQSRRCRRGRPPPGSRRDPSTSSSPPTWSSSRSSKPIQAGRSPASAWSAPTAESAWASTARSRSPASRSPRSRSRSSCTCGSTSATTPSGWSTTTWRPANPGGTPGPTRSSSRIPGRPTASSST